MATRDYANLTRHSQESVQIPLDTRREKPDNVRTQCLRREDRGLRDSRTPSARRRAVPEDDVEVCFVMLPRWLAVARVGDLEFLNQLPVGQVASRLEGGAFLPVKLSC